MVLIKCPECGREVSSIATACPSCGAPIDTAIRCVKYGSENSSVISGASKAVSLAMWGVLMTNRVMSNYKCNYCGHKF